MGFLELLTACYGSLPSGLAMSTDHPIWTSEVPNMIAFIPHHGYTSSSVGYVGGLVIVVNFGTEPERSGFLCVFWVKRYRAPKGTTFEGSGCYGRS